MHRHDGARTGRESSRQARRVKVAGSRVGLDGNGGGTYMRHGQPSGNVGIRRYQHFVAGTDTERPQRQRERFQPVTHPNGVRYLIEQAVLLLKLRYLLSQYVPVRIIHASHGG